MIDLFAVTVALITFGAASWSDIKTRRIKNALWIPAFVIGIALLAARLVEAQTLPQTNQTILAIQFAISFGFIIPLALAFWSYGLFGGADARGLIVLALLVPRFPDVPFTIANTTFPIFDPTLGIFSIAALTNGLLLTAAYPLWVYTRNLRNRVGATLWAFVAVRTPTEDLMNMHGKLVQSPDGMTFGGLDLDALRMYVRWRDTALEHIRANPDAYRTTAPTDPQDVGDGRINPRLEDRQTDVDRMLDAASSADGDGKTAAQTEPAGDDEWAAESFLDDHYAYGTTPKTLRDGLEVIVSNDHVWVTPGIPLIVSFFIGIVSALILGDILAVGIAALS